MRLAKGRLEFADIGTGYWVLTEADGRKTKIYGLNLPDQQTREDFTIQITEEEVSTGGGDSAVVNPLG